MKQRIFLSYASPDSDWVKKFCDQRWFGSLLPDVEIDNYQDMVNFGSIRRWIDEEINSVAVLIAFISRDYIESKYSQVEWQRAREIFAEHNLIVVPIIMDDHAKIWWKERKVEFGRDFGIGGDDSYAFLNFSHPNDPKHVVPIIGLDGPIQVVTQRISDLARLIKSHLKPIKPEPVLINLEPVIIKPEPATDKPEPPAALSTLVVLGHPTSAMQKVIVQAVEELTTALSGSNVHPKRWGDEWTDPDQPAARGNDGVIDPDALFVQPAAPRDAMAWGPAMPKILDGWLKDSMPKFDKMSEEKPERRIVLWLPSEHATDDFRRLAAEKPTLRHDSPRDLAAWIRNDLGISTVSGPAVTIEAIDQGRLRQALEAGCADVVGIVTPPPDLWSFYDRQSLIKQLEIGGKRAIVAVHDLNTPRAPNWRVALAGIESKIKALKECIGAMETTLDLFWTVMVVNKAKQLPFVKFPGSKLPNVALLPFNEVEDPSRPYIVEPNPDALRVVQSYVQDWVNARA